MAFSEVASVIAALKNGIGIWDRFQPEDPQGKLDAIEKVLEAVLATRAYLFDKEVLRQADRDVEKELALAWQGAAAAILKYDEKLHDSSGVKALGWADPRTWPEWKKKAKTIDLDLIEKQCLWLRDNDI